VQRREEKRKEKNRRIENRTEERRGGKDTCKNLDQLRGV
jgi:hypothetical protein